MTHTIKTTTTKALGISALAAFAGCSGATTTPTVKATTATAKSAPATPAAPAASFGSTRSLALIEARVGAAVASLGSGASVLVAGGRTPAAEATDTAEVIDASEAASSPAAGRLATARAGAHAVTLSGNRVLVFGGHDAAGKALASSEIFDGLAGAFGAGPNLAAPRDGAAIAFVSSSQVAILGGTGEMSVEVLDTVSLKFTKLTGSLERAHVGAQARVIGDVIVLAGGEDAPETFDLKTATASTPARPEARTDEALVSTPSAVLLVGGMSTKGVADSQAQEIASPFKTITSLHTIGSPRALGQSVAFGSGELLLGGQDDKGDPIVTTDLVDPTSLGTKPGPELSRGRFNAAAIALSSGDVLVVGGQDDKGQPLANVDLLLTPGAAAPDAQAAFDAAKSAADFKAWQAAQIVAEKTQIGATTATLSSETQANANAQDTINGLDTQLSAAQGTVKTQATQITSLQSQLAQVQTQLTQVQGQLTTTQATLTQTTTQLQQSQAALAQANSAGQQSQTQIASLNQTIAQQGTTISNQNATIAQQNQTITSLQSQLSAAKQTPVTATPVTIEPTKLTPVTITPRPTPAPIASPTPAPTSFPGVVTPFGDAYVNSVSPNPARAGQQVVVNVSPGHAPVLGGVQVLFEGVQAQVVSSNFGPSVGTINVIVPKLPAGLYHVQFMAGNYVSHTFTFTVQ